MSLEEIKEEPAGVPMVVADTSDSDNKPVENQILVSDIVSMFQKKLQKNDCLYNVEAKKAFDELLDQWRIETFGDRKSIDLNNQSLNPSESIQFFLEWSESSKHVEHQHMLPMMTDDQLQYWLKKFEGGISKVIEECGYIIISDVWVSICRRVKYDRLNSRRDILFRIEDDSGGFKDRKYGDVVSMIHSNGDEINESLKKQKPSVDVETLKNVQEMVKSIQTFIISYQK